HWDRLESRLDENIREVLDYLARFDVRATFFVSGWTAERHPRTIERIAGAGHEIASAGYEPRRPRDIAPDAFRDDLRRGREILEAVGGRPVVGYRSPHWTRADELWTLDVLAEEGYLYDSSINPVLRHFAHDPRRFEVHRHRHAARDLSIWEFPVSTVDLF